MPNKIRGESAFLAGTDRYVMRLTLGALAEIEDGLGVSSLSEIASKMKSLGTKDFATVASALLRGGGHHIAPGDVMKIDTDLGTLVTAITEAFSAAGLNQASNNAPGSENAGPLAGSASSNSPLA